MAIPICDYNTGAVMPKVFFFKKRFFNFTELDKAFFLC